MITSSSFKVRNNIANHLDSTRIEEPVAPKDKRTKQTKMNVSVVDSPFFQKHPVAVQSPTIQHKSMFYSNVL